MRSVVVCGRPVHGGVYVEHHRKKFLLRFLPELTVVTPVGVTDFLGSIVMCGAHSSSCGLDSGGKSQIWDRAMEALLFLLPSWRHRLEVA